jgi:hypothetical protein
MEGHLSTALFEPLVWAGGVKDNYFVVRYIKCLLVEWLCGLICIVII